MLLLTHFTTSINSENRTLLRGNFSCDTSSRKIIISSSTLCERNFSIASLKKSWILVSSFFSEQWSFSFVLSLGLVLTVYSSEYNIVSSASFASSHFSSGVRGVTSEQSSYHKLRLVLRGDLDLLSNLFLGVLLGVDLTIDTYMKLFFLIVEIWMEIFARSFLVFFFI